MHPSGDFGKYTGGEVPIYNIPEPNHSNYVGGVDVDIAEQIMATGPGYPQFIVKDLGVLLDKPFHRYRIEWYMGFTVAPAKQQWKNIDISNYPAYQPPPPGSSDYHLKLPPQQPPTEHGIPDEELDF